MIKYEMMMMNNVAYQCLVVPPVSSPQQLLLSDESECRRISLVSSQQGWCAHTPCGKGCGRHVAWDPLSNNPKVSHHHECWSDLDQYQSFVCFQDSRFLSVCSLLLHLHLSSCRTHYHSKASITFCML